MYRSKKENIPRQVEVLLYVFGGTLKGGENENKS